MQAVEDIEVKENIGANIRRLLAARKISQNGLATLIDESPTRINHYAQAKKMPGAGVLSRIAEALGVTTDDLIAPPPDRRGGRGKKSA